MGRKSKRKLIQKFAKLSEILIDIQLAKWCIVDINNEFIFNGYKFKIDKSVPQYKVKKTPSETHNWENLAEMDKVFCLDTGDELRFYDMNIDEIEHVLVRQIY